MAMRFMDSCDHYDLKQYISLKWNANVNNAGDSVPNGRNGRGITGTVGKTLDYQASWVVGWAYNSIGNVWTQADLYYISAANEHILGLLRVENDGTLSLFAGNSLTFLGNTATTSFGAMHPATWYYFEVKTLLTGGGGSPLTMEMWLHIDGVPVLTALSGSTGVLQSQTLLGLTAANYHQFAGAGTLNGIPIMDDFYIAAIDGTGTVNDFAGDVMLGVLFPRADVTFAWTAVGGSTSTGWDHVNCQFPEINDDTIYIKDTYTGGAGDIANFDWQPVAAFTGQIIAVHYGVFNRKDSEGTRTFKQIAQLVPAGDGPVISPGDSFVYNFYAMDADPATGVQWTQSGFNAATFGVQMLS